MAKVLILDDDSRVASFNDYQRYFDGNEVHHRLYLDKERLRYRKGAESKLPDFKERYGLESSLAVSHEEAIDYLRSEAANFDLIVLDGLEGKCFTLIDDVPLPPDKTLVFSSSPRILKDCDAKGVAHDDKG